MHNPSKPNGRQNRSLETPTNSVGPYANTYFFDDNYDDPFYGDPSYYDQFYDEYDPPWEFDDQPEDGLYSYPYEDHDWLEEDEYEIADRYYPSHCGVRGGSPSARCRMNSRKNHDRRRYDEKMRGKQHTPRHRIVRQKAVRSGRDERQFRDRDPGEVTSDLDLQHTQIGPEYILPYGPEGWDQY